MSLDLCKRDIKVLDKLADGLGFNTWKNWCKQNKGRGIKDTVARGSDRIIEEAVVLSRLSERKRCVEEVEKLVGILVKKYGLKKRGVSHRG